MSNPAHRDRRQELLDSLSRYEAAHGALPGIVDPAWRETLVAQFISSLRRIEFIRSLLTKDIDERRLDPASPLFDPLQGSTTSPRPARPCRSAMASAPSPSRSGGNLFSGLFGGGGSGSSSGGNIFSSLFGSVGKIFGFKEGGTFANPVTSYSVGMGAFANAPHYSEGVENTSGGRPAILHDDEAVIPLSRGREIPVRLTGNDSSANDNGRIVTNNVTMNIVTPDAASFGKSAKQTKRDMSVGLQVASARS